MSKKWYTMKAVNKKAEINIYADIGMWGMSAAMFKKELKSLGEFDTIDIRINSYGGEVFDGFAIYNLLKEQSADVSVIIDGIAASIASVIAMAGKTIKMHSNAMLMIHNPGVMMFGEANDLRRSADVLDDMKKSAIQAYQRHAKDLTEKDISDLMDDSTYMTAEEAKAWGFIDEILPAINIEEPETNTSISVPVNFRKNVFTNKSNIVNKEENAMNCKKCGKSVSIEGNDLCIDCLREKEVNEAKNEEMNRICGINAICSASGLSQEFTNKMIMSGKTVSDLTNEISQEIKNKSNLPPVSIQIPEMVDVIADDSDKFREHAVNCLSVVSGIEKDQKIVNEIRKGEQINSVHGLMRRILQRGGVDSLGMNAKQLVDASFKMAGTGSSDLPAILGDITNKNMEGTYNEAPVTWDKWVRIKEVPNFNSQKLIKMSNFSDIDDLPEGAAFKNKKLSDKYETVSVNTKGNIFTITRQALVNDDLDAITGIPRAMVQAIARRQNKDVYDVLTSNTLVGPTMNEDSVALFNATYHFNLVATSGVPSVTSINTAERKLLEMPLLKAEATDVTTYANIPAKYLITGTINKLVVQQLLNTAYDNSKSITGVYNPYANNAIIPIFDAYLNYLLNANSKAYAWYLAADPMQMPHIVMSFLQGQRTPSLRSEGASVGDAQGFTYEIYGDWGVGAEDYRGIVYNDGASS